MYCAFRLWNAWTALPFRKPDTWLPVLLLLLTATGCQRAEDRRALALRRQMAHPEVQARLRIAQQGKVPGQVPPDQAAIQDFLMTMDPVLGYPNYEKLFEVRRANLSRIGGKNFAINAWTSLGPNNIAGRARAILWDPTDPTGKKVWAGAVTGGLWYTTDITVDQNWVRVDDFWASLAITSIAVDPTNNQVWYVGTGEGWFTGSSRGAGIWKTTNAGQTWTQLASTATWPYVLDIVVRNEGGNGVVYAGTNLYNYMGVFHGATDPGPGVMRSINGGTSWTNVLAANASTRDPGNNRAFGVSDLEIGADGRIYAGTVRNNTTGQTLAGRILFSDDGLNWTVVTPVANATNLDRVEIAVAPNDANRVYCLIGGSNNQCEYYGVSNDRGQTWTSATEPGDNLDTSTPVTDFTRGQAFYDLILAVDPNTPTTVVAGGIDLFRITAGNSWQRVSRWNTGYSPTSSYIHADQHGLVYKPGSSNELLNASDGGISWTNQFTASAGGGFQERSRGMVTTQIYFGAVSPNPNNVLVMGGTQDNGTFGLTSNTPGGGIGIRGGDGAMCFIHPTRDLQIASYVYNDYILYRNNGTSPFRLIVRSSNTGLFINRADADWTNDLLWSADNGMLLRQSVIENNGAAGEVTSTFQVDAQLISNERITAVRVAPDNAAGTSVVWAASNGGRLFRVSNAANSSRVIEEKTGPAFPTATINCIAFGRTAQHVIAVFSNYGVASVWESRDGGTSWTNKEGNLPDVPVRWLVTHPVNANRAYVATETGVYTTADLSAASPNWVLVDNGFANVRTDHLVIRNADTTLFAFTHGRGVFATKMTQEELISPPVATAATAVGNAGFVANWNPLAGVDGYAVDLVPAANTFDRANLRNAQGQSNGGRSIIITGSANNRLVAFGLPANTGYKYRVRAFVGTDTSRVSNEISVTTAATATQTLAVTNVGTGICGGQSTTVTYDATGSFGAGVAIRVQLSDATGSFTNPTFLAGTGTTGAGQTLNVTIPAGTAPGTGYRVRVVADNPVLTSAASNAFEVTGITPTISAGGSTAICPGTTVTLTAGGAPAAGTSTYQWFRNGVAIVGATSNTFAATYEGSYTVRIAQAGCSGTSAATAVTFISGTTVPVLTNTGGALSIAGGTAFASYQWRYSGSVNGNPIRGIIVGATGATFNAPVNGNYSLTVTTAAGCRLTTNWITVSNLTPSALPTQIAPDVVSMEDLTIARREGIYPNPATDFTEIVTNSANADAQVQLVNLRGQTVFQTRLGALPAKRIDVASYPTGIYVVRLLDGANTRTYRLLIQR